MNSLNDFLFTPIYLFVIYFIFYQVRSSFTNKNTRRFFIPAITVKIIGALSLGIIYYHYYGGGDTTQYYKESTVIIEALSYDPIIAAKLLLTSDGSFDSHTYPFASRIGWFGSSSEYPVIKFAALFSMLGLGSYAVAAIFFAALSFTGIWAMYITFIKIYPHLYKQFAISILFLPSVFFWGSGLLKDSITLGCLGWLFYSFYELSIEKKRVIFNTIIILITSYLIFNIKVYILLSFLPPAFIWIFNENSDRIKNKVFRYIAKPLLIITGSVIAYFIATTLTAGDVKYDINNIAERTAINNEYLSQFSPSGSAYKIATFDGSLSSILKVAPDAITVSLFRPFLWEISSFIMLFSALESLMLTLLTSYIFIKVGILKTLKLISSEPIILFCIIFSMVFAFAVGTNSGNFGTLVRYKIPLLPFYLSALFIMESLVNNKNKKNI